MKRIDPWAAETAAEFMDAQIEISGQEADRAGRSKRNATIAMAAGYTLAAAGVGLEFKELFSHEYVTHLNELYVKGIGVGMVSGIGFHIRAARSRMRNSRLMQRVESLTRHKERPGRLANRIGDILGDDKIAEDTESRLEESLAVEAVNSGKWQRKRTQEQIEAARSDHDGNVAAAGTLTLTGGVLAGTGIMMAGEATNNVNTGSDPGGLLSLILGVSAGAAVMAGTRFVSDAAEANTRVAELQTESIIQEYDMMRAAEAGHPL
jgi:hypothetical protein